MEGTNSLRFLARMKQTCEHDAEAVVLGGPLARPTWSTDKLTARRSVVCHRPYPRLRNLVLKNVNVLLSDITRSCRSLCFNL